MINIDISAFQLVWSSYNLTYHLSRMSISITTEHWKVFTIVVEKMLIPLTQLKILSFSKLYACSFSAMFSDKLKINLNEGKCENQPQQFPPSPPPSTWLLQSITTLAITYSPLVMLPSSGRLKSHKINHSKRPWKFLFIFILSFLPQINSIAIIR